MGLKTDKKLHRKKKISYILHYAKFAFTHLFSWLPSNLAIPFILFGMCQDIKEDLKGLEKVRDFLFIALDLMRIKDKYY